MILCPLSLSLSRFRNLSRSIIFYLLSFPLSFICILEGFVFLLTPLFQHCWPSCQKVLLTLCTHVQKHHYFPLNTPLFLQKDRTFVLIYFSFVCVGVCVCDLLQILPFPSQVVYNRVGKCGSRTVVILLKTLAEKHQFNLISSDIHNKTRLSKHEQVRPEGYCWV